MSKIIDFFKRRKKKAESPEMGMEGQDFHIQPTTATLRKRSLARVKRLQHLVANGAPVSYKEELDRRVKELKRQGVLVLPYKGA